MHIKKACVVLLSFTATVCVSLISSCEFVDQTTPSTQIDAMIEAANDHQVNKGIINTSRSDMEAHMRACDTITTEHK